MGGYDALNLQYTRAHNVANILNEMLKHLLFAKPKDPCDSLVGFLESEAGRRALGVEMCAEEVKEEIEGDVGERADAPEYIEDETLGQTGEYERGVGIRALLRDSGAVSGIWLLQRCVEMPLYVAVYDAHHQRPTPSGDARPQPAARHASTAADYARGAGVAALAAAGATGCGVLRAAMRGEYRRGSGVSLLRQVRSRSVTALEKAMQEEPEARGGVRGTGVALLRLAGAASAGVLQSALAGAGGRVGDYRRAAGLALLRAAKADSTAVRAFDAVRQREQAYRRGAGVALLQACGSTAAATLSHALAGYERGAGLRLLRSGGASSAAALQAALQPDPAARRGAGVEMLLVAGSGRQAVRALSVAMDPPVATATTLVPSPPAGRSAASSPRHNRGGTPPKAAAVSRPEPEPEPGWTFMASCVNDGCVADGRGLNGGVAKHRAAGFAARTAGPPRAHAPLCVHEGCTPGGGAVHGGIARYTQPPASGPFVPGCGLQLLHRANPRGAAAAALARTQLSTCEPFRPGCGLGLLRRVNPNSAAVTALGKAA